MNMKCDMLEQTGTSPTICRLPIETSLNIRDPITGRSLSTYRCRVGFNLLPDYVAVQGFPVLARGSCSVRALARHPEITSFRCHAVSKAVNCRKLASIGKLPRLYTQTHTPRPEGRRIPTFVVFFPPTVQACKHATCWAPSRAVQ
jgi:hypothetical protein